MNFKEDCFLENDAVLLRPLTLDDFEHLKSFVINEPEIWTYSLVSIKNEVDLKNYLQSAVQARKEGKEYPFIVYDKLKHEYAGSTRFYDIQLAHQTTQLGYTWYGKKFQGTYVNKNCKYLLLQFAFEQLNLERVEFRADHNNMRSKAAMLSIGCVLEGTLRNQLSLPDGKRRSSIVLSILKQEWIDRVKHHLFQKI